MGVDYTHKEYDEHIETWDKIRSVCDGDGVKRFLRELNPHDRTPENRTRNKQYKDFAVFYKIAGQTAQGLVGMMFAKPPVIELPQELEYMMTNVDGAGVGIVTQAQDLAGDVVEVARGGLFVTYPKVEGELSKADLATGNYYPTIHEYEAEQIINWDYSKRGSQVVLSLVVLREEATEAGDGYTKVEVEQLRELRLTKNGMMQTLWRLNDKKEWYEYEVTVPTDGSGDVWDIIPFTFVGAESNSADIDESMMESIVDLNIAHYRNSADYEDSVWFCGQPQPWMSGITQSHIDLMKKNNMYAGSRNVMGVPSGETFGYASPNPNPMVKEAMDAKLDGMIGMGARYIMPNNSTKTATEAASDNAVAHSHLAVIANNISMAYSQCIEWAMRYVGIQADFTFRISTDFVKPHATAQEIQAIIAGYVQGAIPMSDYFAWLKRMELVDGDKDIDQFAEELNSVTMPDMSNG